MLKTISRMEFNEKFDKKILILSNHYITTSFRRELIEQLVNRRHQVFLSTPKSPEDSYFTNQHFRDLGCQIVDTPFNPRGLNPFGDLRLLISYIKMMRNIKPDIIFSYTIKPNIYGAIAARLTGQRQISTITGTGVQFLDDNLVSKMAKLLYRFSLKDSEKVFFQNQNDKDFFLQNQLVGDNYAMLPGSGVNLNKFQLCKFLPTNNSINFLYIGRVLKLKGIRHYLAAAKCIKTNHPNTNFYVAGYIVDEQYRSIIYDYHRQDIIQFLGFQRDIKPWIEKCHCIIQPSLAGEGVPNTLLESAAMGRACIGSDIPGCRDVIDDGVTGFLFKCGSTTDLIEKVQKYLALDHDSKAQMGIAGRKKVEREFDRQIVVDAYMHEVDRFP